MILDKYTFPQERNKVKTFLNTIEIQKIKMNLGESVYRVATELESSPSGLAFDIDDCLAQTSRGYFDLLSLDYPPPANLTSKQVTKYYALHGQILYWGNIPEADQYAWQQVNNQNFHSKLIPFPDASDQTKALNQQNLFGCYLTVRGETMRDSTEQWLTEHNFPTRPLIMRDEHIDFSSHTQWKVAVVHYLHPTISGVVDNDTRIIELLEQQNYPGRLYLFGLSPKESPSNGSVIARATWPEMAAAILSSEM